MVNNYEQNIETLMKKLKNVTGLLEQKVCPYAARHCIVSCYLFIELLQYS